MNVRTRRSVLSFSRTSTTFLNATALALELSLTTPALTVATPLSLFAGLSSSVVADVEAVGCLEAFAACFVCRAKVGRKGV
jgi:hypothetical protein